MRPNQPPPQQPELDLDMLAYDIADLLSRNEYPMDVSASDIRSALPAFLEQVRKNAAVDHG